MPAVLDQPIDLVTTNDVLETYQPRQIVDWAAREFGDGLVMSSSFGAESALLIHMATQALPGIKLIMVDTGYLFPETFRFLEDLRHRFDLNVWLYRTQQDPIAYLKEAAETDPTTRLDVARCCAVNKNEPFERAMRQLKPAARLRGIRRNQADTRQSKQIVEFSNRYNCYAISPLLNSTRRDIHTYMKQHDLPYHPLYEKGYASIGCNPLSCTRPIQIGEDPRAGRWSGSGKVECGLHLENGAGI
jgi:phosphoadenosine phosphosulfate reductase